MRSVLANWKGALVFLVAIIGATLLYWDATSGAIMFWAGSFNYDYGTLLVAVVMLIAVSEVADKTPFAETPNWFAFTGVFVTAAILVFSTLAAVISFQILMLLFLVWLLVLAIFGWVSAKNLAFPFAILLLVVPVWDFMVPPLQKTTVSVVNYLLGVLGRTAYVDGDFVVLRYGTFHVEEACSGMNFLIAGMILSSLYAYWYLRGWLQRSLIIVVGAAAVIIGNWLRVFIIVMAGDLSQMQHSLVKDHIGLGWIVFFAMMLVVPLCAHLFSTLPPRIEQGRLDHPGRMNRHSNNVAESGSFQRVMQAIILSFAIVLPATFLWVIETRNSEGQLIAIEWPDYVGDLSRVSDVEKSAALSYFPKATVSESRFFRVERQYVRVDTFAYDLRDKTAELIGYPNQWFDRDKWHVLRQHSVRVADKSALLGPRVLHLQSRSRAVILAGGYLIGDAVTGNNVEAKIVGTLGLLREQAAGAAVFVTMDCKDDCYDEEQIVSEFFLSLLGSSSFGLRIEPIE